MATMRLKGDLTPEGLATAAGEAWIMARAARLREESQLSWTEAQHAAAREFRDRFPGITIEWV